MQRAQLSLQLRAQPWRQEQFFWWQVLVQLFWQGLPSFLAAGAAFFAGTVALTAGAAFLAGAALATDLVAVFDAGAAFLAGAVFLATGADFFAAGAAFLAGAAFFAAGAAFLAVDAMHIAFQLHRGSPCQDVSI